MKKIPYIFAMSMILIVNKIGGQDIRKDALFSYCQKIDLAAANKQINDLVLLLIDLESCTEQRFGNGYGPFDKTSLQITIINILYRLSGDKESLNINNFDRLFDVKKDEEWLEFFKLPSNSFDSIEKMLKHNNPAIRYYGIIKLQERPPLEIIDILQKIVDHDDYIVLAASKKKIVATNGLPDNGIVGGIQESIFKARLRDVASQKLNSWGVKSCVDDEQVSRDGIIVLAQMYQNGNRLLKEEILESINLFSIGSLPAESLMNFDYSNVADQKKSIIELFRKQLIQEYNKKMK